MYVLFYVYTYTYVLVHIIIPVTNCIYLYIPIYSPSRTTIYPNEAQSWRRTALLMHQLGHEELAESARYTAYELGKWYIYIYIDIYIGVCICTDVYFYVYIRVLYPEYHYYCTLDSLYLYIFISLNVYAHYI